MLMNNNFFQEQREQSSVKTRIVAKYFSAWVNVIVSTQKKRPQTPQKMAYIDLFSGAGKYGDDNKSTPILVLETILKSDDLSERMITMFNDKDTKSIESLKSAVNQIEGIENLKYPPIFFNKEVGEDIAKIFDSTTLVPTLFFVDPWGYKGLSLELIASIVKDWGCDCVFFFNYNRISIGLNNPIVDVHSVGKPYIKRNYKEVLKALYESGKITSVHNKTGKPPRKGTFSDEMKITFGGKQ
jgi:three-Cys-motif partner protein